MPVQASVAGTLLGFLAEDIHCADNAAEAVLDRCNVDERDNAGTVGPLDDDFLIAHSLPGREHIAHRTFRVRHQITKRPVGSPIFG